MQMHDEQLIATVEKQKAASRARAAEEAILTPDPRDQLMAKFAPPPDAEPAPRPWSPPRPGFAPAPRRLDEAALRRPDFCGGAAIELSDGQTWTFAVPTLSDYYPSIGKDGKPALVSGYDMGPAYDQLTDDYIDAETAPEELAILACLAFELLSRNYTLAFADMKYLLRVKRVGDPAQERNVAMWSLVADAAFGRSSKKPSADGSAS